MVVSEGQSSNTGAIGQSRKKLARNKPSRVAEPRRHSDMTSIKLILID